MTSISINRICQSAWDDVIVKVNKAVVFLDGPAAESFHWAWGGERLVSAGAVNIKEFSSFEVIANDIHIVTSRDAIFPDFFF